MKGSKMSLSGLELPTHTYGNTYKRFLCMMELKYRNIK